MFKTPADLKAFITWARDNKIKRVKVDNLEFEVSDLAFIPELNAPISHEVPKETQKQAQTSDDDDLYWSAGN